MKKIQEKIYELNSTYMGVVVDRDDPKQMGRVRVRVYGLHTVGVGEIITSKLPWFLPAYPINVASLNGQGDSGIPELDSHVLVSFIQGNVLQGYYFATVPGEGDIPNPTDYTEDHRQIKTKSGDTIDFETDNGITITNNNAEKETKINIKDNEITIKTDKSTISLVDGVINITGQDTVNISGKNINIEDSTNVGNFIINSDKFLKYFMNHLHGTGVGPSSTVIAGNGLEIGQDWFTTTAKVVK